MMWLRWGGGAVVRLRGSTGFAQEYAFVLRIYTAPCAPSSTSRCTDRRQHRPAPVLPPPRFPAVMLPAWLAARVPPEQGLPCVGGTRHH